MSKPENPMERPRKGGSYTRDAHGRLTRTAAPQPRTPEQDRPPEAPAPVAESAPAAPEKPKKEGAK